jgi:hypothetical protein
MTIIGVFKPNPEKWLKVLPEVCTQGDQLILWTKKWMPTGHPSLISKDLIIFLLH